MTVERDIDNIEVKPVGAIEFRNPVGPGGLFAGTDAPGPDEEPDEGPWGGEDPGGHGVAPAQ